jgi:uncharacterized protein YndB with AHSA1/START domain
MSQLTTDRIQKEILIKAPRPRVWRAISEPLEFGAWFKVDMSGAEFRPGQPVQGKMTYPGYEGMPFEMEIDRIEAERLFSFRWHPYAVETKEFTLDEVADGTRLTIVESGFDAIPLARRAEAFRMNEGGWEEQIHNVEAYVTRGS